MPLQPITARRLYLQIADQLAQAIRDGEYAVGGALPAERVLAEQLRVSRASVREALIALQLMGLVDVRPGGGTFVISANGHGVSSDQMNQEIGAFDLLHARQMLEGEIAALAAREATSDDMSALQDCLTLMRHEIETNQPDEEGDRRFHIQLATMTRNAVLEMLVRQLWEMRQDRLWDVLHVRAFTHAHRLRYLADHERILACVAAHDSDAARQEMHHHLERLEEFFLTS